MKKNNELIERYLYAVSAYLPYRQKDDIINELRSIIDDMLDERCGDISPSEKDIRVVLAELGTPDEVGVQYGLGKQKSLISGTYFIKYKLLLKILLFAVLGGLSLSTLINIGLNNVGIVSGVYKLLGDIFSVGISLVGIVTIIFYFLERKSVDLKEFKFETLPPVPKKQEKISLVESVIGIVINIAIAIIFLVSPQILEFSLIHDNVVIPIINVDFIRNVWFIILLISIPAIIDDIVKIIDRKYTKRVMIVNIITNAISLVGLLYLYDGNKIFSKEYLDFAMQNSNSIDFLKFIPLMIVIFFVLETAVTIYKTLKIEKQQN